jgi:hypothetical protein
MRVSNPLPGGRFNWQLTKLEGFGGIIAEPKLAYRFPTRFTVSPSRPLITRVSWRTESLLHMAPRPKLPPVQVLQRLQHRVEKRMEALQRTKLDRKGLGAKS